MLMSAVIFYSCNKNHQEAENGVLDKSPIVGKIVTTHNQDKLIVCDISLLKDTIDNSLI